LIDPSPLESEERRKPKFVDAMNGGDRGCATHEGKEELDEQKAYDGAQKEERRK
jgi:hypothetical protein